MPDLMIRPALRSDAAEIAQVQQESWEQAYQNIVPKGIPLRAVKARIAIWQERIEEDPCHTLLAEHDGALVGFLYWNQEKPGSAHLRSLYLHPLFWRQGIGSQLLQQAEQDMRRAGFSRLGLWVLQGNVRAERFYQHHGFRYDGRVEARQTDAGSYQQRYMYKRMV